VCQSDLRAKMLDDRVRGFHRGPSRRGRRRPGRRSGTGFYEWNRARQKVVALKATLARRLPSGAAQVWQDDSRLNSFTGRRMGRRIMANDIPADRPDVLIAERGCWRSCRA